MKIPTEQEAGAIGTRLDGVIVKGLLETCTRRDLHQLREMLEFTLTSEDASQLFVQGFLDNVNNAIEMLEAPQ